MRSIVLTSVVGTHSILNLDVKTHPSTFGLILEWNRINRNCLFGQKSDRNDHIVVDGG